MNRRKYEKPIFDRQCLCDDVILASGQGDGTFSTLGDYDLGNWG